MKLLGLTGGIGMGKSSCARYFDEAGGPVLDTDVIARQVVAPGTPALREIKEAFGGQVIGRAGCLDRAALARLVFADPNRRKQLEAIVHPRIREVWQRQVNEWREAGRRWALVVIPLLFETHAEDQFDFVICVACSLATQMERLKSRRWTDEESRRRIEAQWPVEKKMAGADYVVWTEGALEVCGRQVRRILEGEGLAGG